MGNQLSKKFFVFLGILLLINLLQAHFTPLIYDETYYWYYSQNMAWGYFDHPPMVALLAKISGLFFDGEIGVRLIGCFLGIGTVIIVWLLVDDKQKEKQTPLFFLLAFSMVLFNAYGFLTLPDTPLLFFTALFLWIYRGFLKKSSMGLAIVLGLCMACLLYSKYHGVLVIFFVFLSNVKLVRNIYAWAAILIALAAYSPHLFWLVENDFISIKYHLFERPNQSYSFDRFTLAYLLNLIANFGLLFPWFYWALFKTKSKDQFQKSLLFVCYGIILFFFLSSFQRKAQAQWVIVICVPMLVITFNYIVRYLGNKKWLWRVGLFSTVLIVYARIWLIYHPLIPFLKYETHGPKEWVRKVNEIVGDTPIVFENGYRRASMYSFYSGNPTFSLNSIFYRQNQYSIDNSESHFQNKRIAFVTPHAKSGEFTYAPFRSRRYYGWFINDFKSFRKLRCFLDKEIANINGDIHTLKVFNPYDENITLNKLQFNVAYLDRFRDTLEIKPISLNPIASRTEILKANDTTKFHFKFPKTTGQKPHFLKFSISENNLPSGLNSVSIKVKR